MDPKRHSQPNTKPLLQIPMERQSNIKDICMGKTGSFVYPKEMGGWGIKNLEDFSSTLAAKV